MILAKTCYALMFSCKVLGGVGEVKLILQNYQKDRKAFLHYKVMEILLCMDQKLTYRQYYTNRNWLNGQ